MSIIIELNELPDVEIQKAAEKVICDSIGDRPPGEEWRVSIEASPDYCRILIKGPNQSRGKFFFDQGNSLPNAISNWLQTYPFR